MRNLMPTDMYLRILGGGFGAPQPRAQRYGLGGRLLFRDVVRFGVISWLIIRDVISFSRTFNAGRPQLAHPQNVTGVVKSPLLIRPKPILELRSLGVVLRGSRSVALRCLAGSRSASITLRGSLSVAVRFLALMLRR